MARRVLVGLRLAVALLLLATSPWAAVGQTTDDPQQLAAAASKPTAGSAWSSSTVGYPRDSGALESQGAGAAASPLMRRIGPRHQQQQQEQEEQQVDSLPLTPEHAWGDYEESSQQERQAAAVHMERGQALETAQPQGAFSKAWSSLAQFLPSSSDDHHHDHRQHHHQQLPGTVSTAAIGPIGSHLLRTGAPSNPGQRAAGAVPVRQQQDTANSPVIVAPLGSSLLRSRMPQKAAPQKTAGPPQRQQGPATAARPAAGGGGASLGSQLLRSRLPQPPPEQAAPGIQAGSFFMRQPHDPWIPPLSDADAYLDEDVMYDYEDSPVGRRPPHQQLQAPLMQSRSMPLRPGQMPPPRRFPPMQGWGMPVQAQQLQQQLQQLQQQLHQLQQHPQLQPQGQQQQQQQQPQPGLTVQPTSTGSLDGAVGGGADTAGGQQEQQQPGALANATAQPSAQQQSATLANYDYYYSPSSSNASFPSFGDSYDGYGGSYGSYGGYYGGSGYSEYDSYGGYDSGYGGYDGYDDGGGYGGGGDYGYGYGGGDYGGWGHPPQSNSTSNSSYGHHHHHHNNVRDYIAEKEPGVIHCGACCPNTNNTVEQEEPILNRGTEVTATAACEKVDYEDPGYSRKCKHDNHTNLQIGGSCQLTCTNPLDYLLVTPTETAWVYGCADRDEANTTCGFIAEDLQITVEVLGVPGTGTLTYTGSCTVTAVARCCKQLCRPKQHHHRRPKPKKSYYSYNDNNYNSYYGKGGKKSDSSSYYHGSGSSKKRDKTHYSDSSGGGGSSKHATTHYADAAPAATTVERQQPEVVHIAPPDPPPPAPPPRKKVTRRKAYMDGPD